MLVRSENLELHGKHVRKTRKYYHLDESTIHLEVLGDEQVVTGVKALNKTTGETFDIPATGFFVLLDTNQILIFSKILSLWMKLDILLILRFQKNGRCICIWSAADHVYRQAVYRCWNRLLCTLLMPKDIWLLKSNQNW
jgi:thioredoxin reductase (NADPH)